MIIFEKQGVIAPDKDKTNIPFEFEVPAGVSALCIDYSYSPKNQEDVQAAERLVAGALEKYLGRGHGKDPRDFLPVSNLITLSVDSPSGYRGAAHRQSANQHIELSAGSASPGFVKGEPESGRWRVVLNVHCCACEVSFDLKISGGENA